MSYKKFSSKKSTLSKQNISSKGRDTTREDARRSVTIEMKGFKEDIENKNIFMKKL